MRRLALLVSLVAVVATTGTAAGSVDRTPKSVVEDALLKVRPAADLASAGPTRGNRVRVIMELDDPPLAAATYARGIAGLGVRQKLNMRSAFSRMYLSTLEAEQARAIADLHEAMPDALVSRRYQVLVNGFAVSVPYAPAAEAPRHEDRDEGVPELLVPPRPQQRAIRARRAAVRRH